MRRPALALVLLSLLAGTGFAQGDEALLCPPAPTVEPPAALSTSLLPEAERLAHFQNVWQTIRVNHLFALVPDHGSGDLTALRLEYEPLLRAATSDLEFYEAVAEMVQRFDGPWTFYRPAWLSQVAGTAGRDYVGIGALQNRASVEREGEYLRIKAVYPGSPAQAAGLQPRDRILAVDGQPCPAVNRILGEEGTIVTLTIQSPGQPPREVQVTRGRITLPDPAPVLYRLEAEPNLAYLRVPSLESAMVEELQVGLARLLGDSQSLEGLVIDLRDSRGTARQVEEGILGHFVSGGIYRHFSRRSDTVVEVRASSLYPRLSTLPLALLVDGDTAGTAERVALALSTRGNGRLIGSTTAGRTHGYQTLELTDGALLTIPTHAVKLLDDTVVEGVGLIPDIAVDADWTEYAEAEDPYLLAAIEYLTGQAVAGTSDRADNQVVQAASVARLVLEPADAQPGEELRVSFENAPGYEQDWITLVETSESPTTYGDYYYLHGETEGVLTFTAPSTPGSYEARFYQDWPDGGYVVVARSNPITVVEQQGSTGAQAAEQPVPTASCTPSRAGDVSFENAEQGYCLVHDSRWLVIEEGSADVTLRIPPEGAPESMALSIGVTELGADVSLDDVIDAFLEEFFPQQQDFTDVEILERSDALVARQPAKLVVFSGNLLDGEQLLDVVGRVYVVGGPDRKLYILTFILDTTRVPVKAYNSTVDSMVRSFTLTSLPPQ